MPTKSRQSIEEFIYDQTTPPVKQLGSKRMFLTYSCVPPELTHSILLSLLKIKLVFDKYLISKELHKNGEPHFHVILESPTQFAVRNVSVLDFRYEGNTYHGHYKSARRFRELNKI